MDNSAKLKLPFIQAAQAQKHVTHNEALRGLDVVVQLSVLDRDLTAPPASPADGDRYIVAPAATGAWVGQDNKVAAWQDNAWAFHTPQEGWRCWVEDEQVLLIYQAGAWATFSSGGGGASALTDLTDTPTTYTAAANKWLAVNAAETATEFTNQVALAGVNATPDTINRLAVASPATLLNHEGAGHQLKVNKATAADTASLLFQDGFTGHAEFGLMGDDNFRLKVSPDGTSWLEALRAGSDANVTFPTTGALTLPVGTDAQRPATPTAGMLRFNSTSSTVERYDGSAWGALAGSSGGVSTFTGLTDTSNNYAGAAGKAVAVNAGETGLEFVTFPTSSGGGGGGTAPNILVNGDFQINQREFAGGALSAGSYGFDRWKAAIGGANLSLSGFTVTLTSGEIEQVIEPPVWGYDSFASAQVTASVEAPSADLTVTFGSQSGTIAAGTGRQSVTMTLTAADTGNLSFKLKSAAGASVTFSRVKIEVGATATDWQARSLPTEMNIAKRYCQQVMKGNGTSGSSIASFYFQLVAGIVVDGLLSFNPVMRATPTLISPPGTPVYQASNPTSGNRYAFYNNASGGFASGGTSLVFNGAGTTGTGVRIKGSGWTTSNGGVGNVYVGPLINVLADADL